MATFVEAPEEMQKKLVVPSAQLELCKSQGTPVTGSAVGGVKSSDSTIKVRRTEGSCVCFADGDVAGCECVDGVSCTVFGFWTMGLSSTVERHLLVCYSRYRP